jgi:lambda repressor-like predicted transcriptional regulator
MKIWTWADIKCALENRGYSQASFAKKLNVSSVCTVKKKHWGRVEQAISKEIGVPLQILWPDRYAADGTSLYRHRLSRDAAAKKSLPIVE